MDLVGNDQKIASIRNQTHPLMEDMYPLDRGDPETRQDRDFFKTQTDITDDAELRDHIILIQRKAYEVFPYPCIRRFVFTKLQLSKWPVYDHLLQLATERPGALFLDLGCCFGNDTRKIVVDGWPVSQIIASDLHTGFWDLGHELFRDTPEKFPAVFLQGDCLDPKFLAPQISPPSSSTTSPPPLHSLKSLNELAPQLSAIHASALFHLFPEVAQRQLALSLATLLSPLPGSTICGWQVGVSDEEGTKIREDVWSKMFFHCPRTWREMWIGVFDEVNRERGAASGNEGGGVEVQVRLAPALEAPPEMNLSALFWSVKRK